MRPDAQDKSGNMGAEGMAEECDRTVCAPRWNAGTAAAENVAFETKRERTCLRKAAIDADSRFCAGGFAVLVTMRKLCCCVGVAECDCDGENRRDERGGASETWRDDMLIGAGKRKRFAKAVFAKMAFSGPEARDSSASVIVDRPTSGGVG